MLISTQVDGMASPLPQGNPRGGKPCCVDLLVAFRPQVETAIKCSQDGFEHRDDVVLIMNTWHKASLGS